MNIEISIPLIFTDELNVQDELVPIDDLNKLKISQLVDRVIIFSKTHQSVSKIIQKIDAASETKLKHYFTGY